MFVLRRILGQFRRKLQHAVQVFEASLDISGLRIDSGGVVVSGGEARVNSQRRAVGIKGFGQFPLGLQHRSPVAVGFGEVRLDGQGPVIVFQRLVVVSQGVEGQATVVEGLGVAGSQAHHLCVIIEGLLEHAQVVVGAGPVEPGMGVFGVQLRRPGIAGDRLLVQSQLVHRHSPVQEGVGYLGIQPDHLIELHYRLLMASSLPQNHCPVVHGLKITGVQFQGPAVIGQRPFHFPQVIMGVAPLIVSLRQIGLADQHFGKLGHSVRRLTQPEAHQPKVETGNGVSRVRRENPAEHGRGLVVASQRVAGVAIRQGTPGVTLVRRFRNGGLQPRPGLAGQPQPPWSGSNAARADAQLLQHRRQISQRPCFLMTSIHFSNSPVPDSTAGPNPR